MQSPFPRKSRDGDGNGDGRRSRECEIVDVDAVPDANHLARCDSVRLDTQAGGVIGNGDDPVGQMAGPAKLYARLPSMPGTLPMSRVHDHRNTGQSRGNATENVRIRVVRMNHIELPATKQPYHL